MIGTEALSLVHALRAGPVLFWWLGGVVLAAGVWGRGRGAPPRAGAPPRTAPYLAGEHPDPDPDPDPTELPSGSAAWCATRLRGVEAALAAAVLSTLALLGVVSTATAPNNLDSLVYMLPRQVAWAQAGTVAHFATDRLRQLTMPPFAEYAGVHLMLLSGGDRFANLVQWAALGASAVVASVIARDLGGGRVAQLLAALLAVTVPPAALQALNAKNDVVLGLWVLVLAAIFVEVVRERHFDIRHAVVGGAALGLAVLTKGTALPILLPLGLATVVAAAVARRRGLLPRLALAGAIALALNTGHFARNLAVFGAPLGADRYGGFGMTNEIHTPAAIASNLVRNVALHLGTPSAAANEALTAGVERIHAWLGISSMSLRTSVAAVPRFAVELDYDEDRASAPVHVVVGGVLLAALIWGAARGRVPARAALYAALPLGALVAFAVGLRWQPWGSRLHVPILLLTAPAMAVAIVGTRERAWAAVIGTLAVAVLVPFLLYGRQKPLADATLLTAGRLETMLRPWPALVDPLRRATAATADLRPRVIGLDVAVPRGDLSGLVEYPVQRTLLDAIPDRPRLIFLWPAVAPWLRDPTLVPDAIVSVRAPRPEVLDEPSGTRFVPHATFPPYTVYRRRG